MKMNEKQIKLIIEIIYNNNINELIIETYNEISLEDLKTKSIKKFNIDKKQKNNLIFYYEDEQGDLNIINKTEDIYEASKEANPYIFNIKLKLKVFNFKNKKIKNIELNENIYKNKYLKENEKLKFELEGVKHEKNKEIKILKNIIKKNEKEYLKKLNRKGSKGNMDNNDINEIKNFMKENKGKSFIQLFIEEKQNFMNEMNKFKQDIIKKIQEELKNNNLKNKRINNDKLVNDGSKKYYNDIINKLDNIIGLSSRKSSNEIINKLDIIIQNISKNQQKLLSLIQKDNGIKNEINKIENRNKFLKAYGNKSSDNIFKNNNNIVNNKLQCNSYKSIKRISYLKKNEFIDNNKEREEKIIPSINNNEKKEIRIEEEENEDDEEEEEEEEDYLKSKKPEIKKPEIKKLEIRKIEYNKPELKTPERQRHEIRKIEIKTPEVIKRMEIKTPERIEGPEIKRRLLKTPDFKGENKDKGEVKMELFEKLKKIEKNEEEEEDEDKEEEEEETEEQIKYSIQLNEKLKDLFFHKNGILKAKPLTINQLEEIENLYYTLLDKKQNIQEYQNNYVNIIKKETNNSNLPEQKKNLIYRQIRIIQELIDKTIKGYKENDNK